MYAASTVTSAPTSTGVTTRPAGPEDAPIVQAVYGHTPGYFQIISTPLPTLDEVRTDLTTAASDPRRHLELILLEPHWPSSNGKVDDTGEPVDPLTGLRVGGYLDYKLDYPDKGDATVNLLLILPWLQSRGIGAACARNLEARLNGHTRRMLASIYGSNPRARSFWERLGYTFAIDARPILDWYAKLLA